MEQIGLADSKNGYNKYELHADGDDKIACNGNLDTPNISIREH